MSFALLSFDIVEAKIEKQEKNYKNYELSSAPGGGADANLRNYHYSHILLIFMNGI